jgi:hypothetical protein
VLEAARTSESWLKRNGHWLWPTIVLLSTGGVGTLIISSLDGRIDSHMDTKLKDPIHDIHQIQIDVARLSGSLNLRVKADLKPEEFKSKLPEVAVALEDALSLKVPASPSVVESIQQKLREADEGAPGFWPAVSRLVNYESAATREFQIPQLPECTFWSSPPNGRVETLNGSKSAPVGHITQDKCAMDLDKRELVENMTFTNSVIRYSGGPLELRSVHFRNCIFIFSIRQKPTPAGERFGKMLLASNLRQVQIP